MNIFYKAAIVVTIFLSGCSNITFNATMCEEIASDPNAIVPQECKIYNEEEAAKAFKNEKNKSSFDINDTVEFSK